MRKSKPTPVKNQSSISSFFTPKTTVNRITASPQNQTSQNPPPSSNGQGNLYEAESDEEEPIRASPKTPPKRILAEDTNGGNTGTPERPAKRSKGDDSEASTFFAGGTPIRSISTTTKSEASPRTQRYLYVASGQVAASETISEENEKEGEEAKARKEQLHQKFVKKLGHPDSIAQIKRRNWEVSEETEALAQEDGEGEEEEPLPPTKTKKKGAKTGKLTPLEKQILDIKRKHMDTLLIIEVGYKFKFYGEDARIAAKELSIVCIPGKMRFDERKYIYAIGDNRADLP